MQPLPCVFVRSLREAAAQVPEFRGINRLSSPSWLVVLCHMSNLFEDYRVHSATGISYCKQAMLSRVVALRLANPQGTRFLQEPDCLDQWHADEEVSWIAVESGAWVDNEGTGGFQAGHVSAQGGMWESVRYHVDFDDMAVMTHVQ